MLPLLSIIKPSDTGTSSRRKILICCGAPFSSTVNALCGRFVTRWPLLSITVTFSGTRRVSLENTASPESCELACGCVAAIGLPDCPNNRNGASIRAAPIKRYLFKVISLSWRVITGPPEGVQLRQPARLHQLDADLPVLSIARLIRWAVAQNILISKLDANLRRHVRQIRQVVDHEVPPPCRFGDIGEKPWSGKLLRSPAARRHRFINADRIDLDVRFLHEVFDFALRVSAAVIAAIGNDDQRFAWVM